MIDLNCLAESRCKFHNYSKLYLLGIKPKVSNFAYIHYNLTKIYNQIYNQIYPIKTVIFKY